MNHKCTREYNILCDNCDDTDACTEFGNLNRRFEDDFEDDSIIRLKVQLEKAEDILKWYRDKKHVINNIIGLPSGDFQNYDLYTDSLHGILVEDGQKAREYFEEKT